MPCVIKWGSVAISAVLIIAAAVWQSLWWVFAIPLGVFLVGQSIVAGAFGSESQSKIFVTLDLVYNVLFMGMLGIAAHVLPQLTAIVEREARLTYEQAQGDLPKLKKAAQQATKKLKETDKAVERLDQKRRADCYFRMWVNPATAQSLGGDTQRVPSLAPNLPGCENVLSTLDQSARATKTVWSAAHELQSAQKVIEAGPKPPWTELFNWPEDRIFFFLYYIFPCALLCGVMLKISQTSHTLLN